MKPRAFFFFFLGVIFFMLPEFALASDGISEFSSPLEKVVNTITGPAGKWISIVVMALCGVIFILNKDDISFRAQGVIVECVIACEIQQILIGIRICITERRIVIQINILITE